MHTRRLWFFAILCFITMTAFVPVRATPAIPAPEYPEDSGDPTGYRNTSGSTSQRSEPPAEPVQAPAILCFTTQADPPTSCSRIENIFDSVTTVSDSETFPDDLAAYDVVYIGANEGDFLKQYSNQLNAYIQDGGGLIISQPNLEGALDIYPPGFEMTVANTQWPEFPDNWPGSVEFTRSGQRHPILTNLGPDDLSGNFDSIPVNRLGGGWVTLAKSVNNPLVALAVGTYGDGRIVFHSGNIRPGSIIPGSDTYIRQMIEWAAAAESSGPNMQIDAIEVTQAIQDLQNSVVLIAGKRTYVRVYITSLTTRNVTAHLSGKRAEGNLFPTLLPGNPGADITVRPVPNRGQINDSFWFELPPDWISAGDLTLTVYLDPADQYNDPDRSNNSASTTVTFQSVPPLRLHLLNVQYTYNGDTYQSDATHLSQLESWLQRTYPISALEVVRSSFIYPVDGLPNAHTLNVWLASGQLLRRMFTGEHAGTLDYGIVDDDGGFMPGKAAGIPGSVASGPAGTPSGTFSWDTDTSYGDWYGGHVLAHALNRAHAEFCGVDGETVYPYPSGRISPELSGNLAIYGFDSVSRMIYDPNWKDITTLCQNQWISDFTYKGIYEYLVAGDPEPEAEPVTADSFLLVSGLVDLETGHGKLDNVTVFDQDGAFALPAAGEWTIALRDADGTDLATYPFAPALLSDTPAAAGRPAVVAEIVPWVEDATTVELRLGDTLVDARSASANAPEVTITSPQAGQQLDANPFTVTWTGTDADDDTLTYSVLYSHNGGQDWRVLSTALTRPQLTLDPGTLPGGSDCQVRIVASDGLLSGMDTSESFVVPDHVPAVTISNPTEAASFFPTQPVQLVGAAYDAEDGSLSAANLVWTSDRDGMLGTGMVVHSVDLSTGTHTITLTATDSAGQSSQAQRTITILAGDATEEGVLDLNLMPAVVGVALHQGDPAMTYAISIRNAAELPANWTISSTVEWAKPDKTQGSLPGDLTLTIDPEGLRRGNYQGELTITSSNAQNSPQTIPLMLRVVSDDPILFIPLIRK